MFRYVAFVWDDFDLAARERVDLLAQRLRDTSSEWQLQVDARGRACSALAFVPASSEARVLHGGKGVVLGTSVSARGRFGRRGARRSSSPEEESRKIRASGGRRLISGYWGRYVVVLHDEALAHDADRAGLRPASFPCFATEMSGVHVYFSRMEDVSSSMARRSP